jgi:nitrite reductase/ring-hydroxylating ferredoxin subunit
MYGGWAQVGFAAEAVDEVCPAEIGSRKLVLVRHDSGLRAYDAICPHRGAHLGYGGELDGDRHLRCPFHGRRIHLGDDADGPYCVAAHPTLDVGGAVYVLLDRRHENGFTAFTRGMSETHYLVPGFTMQASVPPQYVIENVFDADHFEIVHKLNRRPELRYGEGAGGELTVEGLFETNRIVPWEDRPNREGDPEGDGKAGNGAGGGGASEGSAGGASDGAVRTRFLARVFSPTLVATELGSSELASIVITAATPRPDGGCKIRVLLGLPRGGPDGPPTIGVVASLMKGSRTAFEQDLAVWEHLDPRAPSHFGPSDALILAYHDFCRRFDAVAA